jgi:hypothetical protein
MIADRIQTARRTAYSLMGADFHGISGLKAGLGGLTPKTHIPTTIVCTDREVVIPVINFELDSLYIEEDMTVSRCPSSENSESGRTRVKPCWRRKPRPRFSAHLVQSLYERCIANYFVEGHQVVEKECQVMRKMGYFKK